MTSLTFRLFFVNIVNTANLLQNYFHLLFAMLIVDNADNTDDVEYCDYRYLTLEPRLTARVSNHRQRSRAALL